MLLSVLLLLTLTAVPPVVALAVPPLPAPEVAEKFLSLLLFEFLVLSEPMLVVLPLTLVAALPFCAAGLLVPLPVLVLVLVSDLVLLLLLVSEFPLIFVASLPFCAAGLLVPPEVLVFL